MKKVAGYPYTEVQFTKEGKLFEPQEKGAVEKMISDEKLTDLVVLSHGWNNDIDEARNLYQNLLTVLAASQKPATNKRIGVVGIFWPSKKFAEKDLIAGGAASAVSPEEKNRQQLIAQLDNLKDFFDDAKEANKKITAAKKVVKSLKGDAISQQAYVKIMNELLTESIQKKDGAKEENSIPSLDAANPQLLLTKLSNESLEATPAPSKTGGAARVGGLSPLQKQRAAAGIGDFFENILDGARNLLNFVTYYQMKERAGLAGSTGVHDLLQSVQKSDPALRLHLIGHSFGCRLLTAAVMGKTTNGLKVDTLLLLQGAFSHYGFAKKYDRSTDGYFRKVITEGKVRGVILVSFTHNDKAVGLAYAVASRIARQIGSFVGDKNDPYGGLGGNGAQKTPEAIDDFHLGQREGFSFQKGKLYNLNADRCITGHSDICRKEVAGAFWAAFSLV